MTIDQEQSQWPDVLNWSDISGLAEQVSCIMNRVLPLASLSQQDSTVRQAWCQREIGRGVNFRACLCTASDAVVLDKEAGVPVVVFACAGRHRFARYFPNSARSRLSFVSIETEGAIYALGAQEECFLELAAGHSLVYLQPHTHSALSARCLGMA